MQEMLSRQAQYPQVLQHFKESLLVVQRSDCLWGGCFIRGCRMVEQHCMLWLLSMPSCAQVSTAIQELTEVKYNIGQQNKDKTKASHACGRTR